MNNNSDLIKTGKRNIRWSYVFCFIRNFNLTDAVWLLYLAYRGTSLWQIGILEGIFHISGLLFEVPSGAAADLLGRRNVMALGRLCAAASSLFMIFSNGFAGFAIGMVLAALSYNLNSGTEEALLYDSSKMAGEGKNYIKINSRWSVLIEISLAAATFIGAVLAEKSYIHCYVTALIIEVISFFPLLFIREPEMKSRKQGINIREHFKTSFGIIKKNPAVLKILFFYPVVGSFYTTVYFYNQTYLTELGMNKIGLSITFLFCGGMSCVGAFCSSYLFKLLKEHMKYTAAVSIGLGIFLMGTGKLPTVFFAFLAMGFCNSLLDPVKSFSLNQLIPSKQRATIISVESMFFSAAMILFFPLCGLLGDIWGLGRAFIVLGAFLLLFVGIFKKL